MGDGKGAYRILVSIPEGKRPLGRSKRIWKDNIKADQDLEWKGVVGFIWLRIGTGGRRLRMR
jgi:hypothetical protein